MLVCLTVLSNTLVLVRVDLNLSQAVTKISVQDNSYARSRRLHFTVYYLQDTKDPRLFLTRGKEQYISTTAQPRNFQRNSA
jgi:hypothetical protein